MSHKNNMKILANIWNKNGNQSFTCPQCGSSLTMVQVEPKYDADTVYTPYKTVIECNSCSFKLSTESFTILGSVKEFDVDTVEIGSWAPSGSRELAKYKHLLDFNLLKDLKQSGELVEFLVVNKQVIQVIG